jgi:hypothetical protein
MNGIAVPDQLKQAFDEIHTNQLALQFKSDAFAHTINAEAQALAVASKAVWEEAKAVMKLQGDWSYQNGMLFPVEPQNV